MPILSTENPCAELLEYLSIERVAKADYPLGNFECIVE